MDALIIFITYSIAFFMQLQQGVFAKPIVSKSSLDAKRRGFDCKLRGGREILLKVSTEAGSYIQTTERDTGKTVDHRECFPIGDTIYCYTWHIYDVYQTSKSYNIRAVDKNGKTLWIGDQYIVPRLSLFYCYKNHNIKNMGAKVINESVVIQFKINSWDNMFSPKHLVTVGGNRVGKDIYQKSKSCYRSKCRILIPEKFLSCAYSSEKPNSNNSNNNSIIEICVKTKFDLRHSENRYKRRHMTRSCTTVSKVCRGVPQLPQLPYKFQ